MGIFHKFHFIYNFPDGYPFYKKVIANFLFFITGIIIHPRKNLLNHNDLIKARFLLKKGDVILVGNLREVSALFIKGPVTHSTLYVGNKRFIQAVGDGVEYCSLHHIFTEYDTLTILRMPKGVKKRKKIIKDTIRFAEKQIGKPYDFDFSGDSKKFFCTELVNSAYQHAGYKTGLKTIGKFKTVIEKIERIVITAHKALHPEDFIKGNYDIIFTSHNLKLKKKLVFTMRGKEV